MTAPLTSEVLDRCATDRRGPVALVSRQPLVPVEGRGGVFFPPTFADVGYNIDELQDGTKVALVDSVGAQANRIEPLFLEAPFDRLVPQVQITYKNAARDKEGSISLLEAGHRLGDALVRSTELHDEARAAFHALLDDGNAEPIARMAPTSLIFGVWDSRDTMAKVPRLLQAEVRAWDVSPMTRSAQFNPALDYTALDVFTDKEREKAEGKASSPLAQRGFVHVPAGQTHGGVVARGPIRRTVTLNLVQLRRLQAEDSATLRRYLLGLALVAAAEPMEPFLRQGCLLVPDAEQPASWELVHRDGRRESVSLTPDHALAYAESAAAAFGVGEAREVAFDKKRAKADAKAKS